MNKLFIYHEDHISIDLNSKDIVLDEDQLFGIQPRKEFVPMSQIVFNDQSQLKYDTTQMVNLQDYLAGLLRTGEANHFKGYIAIIKQILDGLLIGDKLFFAASENIILEMDAIFVSKADRGVKFMYYPFKEKYTTEAPRIRFAKLMEGFYPYLGDSSEALVLQSKIMQFMRQEDADFRKLRKQLEIWESGVKGMPVKSESNKEKEVNLDGPSDSDGQSKSNNLKVKGSMTKTEEVMVKKIESKTLISIVLIQVAIAAVILLLVTSNVFVSSETGRVDYIQLIGACAAIAGIFEYLMYKFLILDKDIYVETVKVKKVKENRKSAASNQQNLSGAKKARNKGAKNRKAEKPVVSEEVKVDVVAGTELFNDPIDLIPDEEQEQGTVIIDDRPVAYLRYESKGVEETYMLSKDRVTIGRKNSMDFTIPESSISGHHATVKLVDGEFYLIDEESTNKTYLNGERINPNVTVNIQDGDKIKLARTEIIFELG